MRYPSIKVLTFQNQECLTFLQERTGLQTWPTAADLGFLWCIASGLSCWVIDGFPELLLLEFVHKRSISERPNPNHPWRKGSPIYSFTLDKVSIICRYLKSKIGVNGWRFVMAMLKTTTSEMLLSTRRSKVPSSFLSVLTLHCFQ